VCSAFVLSVGLVVACSSESPPTLGNTRDGGSSSGTVDPPVDARRPFPSFRDDVAPIMQQTCAIAACHSSKESNLGIFLREDPVQMYAELKKESPTAVGEKFVVPGDPAKSYLMVKLENKQNTLDAKCANAPLKNCGTIMPPADFEILTPAQIDTFRKWITEGAKDN
jgi:hypothetical protein